MIIDILKSLRNATLYIDKIYLRKTKQSNKNKTKQKWCWLMLCYSILIHLYNLHTNSCFQYWYFSKTLTSLIVLYQHVKGTSTILWYQRLIKPSQYNLSEQTASFRHPTSQQPVLFLVCCATQILMLFMLYIPMDKDVLKSYLKNHWTKNIYKLVFTHFDAFSALIPNMGILCNSSDIFKNFKKKQKQKKRELYTQHPCCVWES